MSDYGYGEWDAVQMTQEAPRVPEPTKMVGEVQVPEASEGFVWEWTTNRIILVGCGILALGFGVWFIMEYTSAKSAHEHGESESV